MTAKQLYAAEKAMQLEAYNQRNKGPLAPVSGFAKCVSCRHFGGQGCIGLNKDENGEWRYCAAFLFGEFGRKIEPMPEYRVTWGNANGAKGQLYVHEDFGCVNHNPEFDLQNAKE